MIRDLDLEINADNVFYTLISDNDFAIIIALDLWKNRKCKVKRNRIQASKINNAITELVKSLQGEKLSGDRWLLLYEIKANKLLKDKEIPDYEENAFFEKLLSLGETFYKSVKYES